MRDSKQKGPKHALLADVWARLQSTESSHQLPYTYPNRLSQSNVL